MILKPAKTITIINVQSYSAYVCVFVCETLWNHNVLGCSGVFHWPCRPAGRLVDYWAGVLAQSCGLLPLLAAGETTRLFTCAVLFANSKRADHSGTQHCCSAGLRRAASRHYRSSCQLAFCLRTYFIRN